MKVETKRKKLERLLQEMGRVLVAFSGGGVMGMCVASLGVLGVGVFYLIFAEKNPAIISGFAMGASSIALFARVGGGLAHDHRGGRVVTRTHGLDGRQAGVHAQVDAGAAGGVAGLIGGAQADRSCATRPAAATPRSVTSKGRLTPSAASSFWSAPNAPGANKTRGRCRAVATGAVRDTARPQRLAALTRARKSS